MQIQRPALAATMVSQLVALMLLGVDRATMWNTTWRHSRTSCSWLRRYWSEGDCRDARRPLAFRGL